MNEAAEIILPLWLWKGRNVIMNSDNLVGITLGNRYDMLEKIGTGGMATVYKAKDTLLNRYVR